MATIFVLALFGYILSFLYKAFSNQKYDINYNKKYRKNLISWETVFLIEDSIFYVYNKLAKFIRAKALNFNRKLEKFNKYIIFATFIHIIGLICSANYIVFPKDKNIKNWVYTDISQKDIEEKAIADSAPMDDITFEEPQSIENSQENDSNSSVSFGINEFNEKIDVPVDNIALSIPPVLTSSLSKKKIDFKTEESQVKIKSGKNILYTEGKISGIDGYGSDGKGSDLLGRGAGKGKGGNGLKEANILGNNIQAGKLGVILDVSSSMNPYITRLKREIRKEFSNAKIADVYGCLLIPECATMRAFQDLINQDVDTIYWFCDLQDLQEQEGLEILNKILKEKNIKLYIKSMDKQPNPQLKSIISSTGGKFFIGLN